MTFVYLQPEIKLPQPTLVYCYSASMGNRVLFLGLLHLENILPFSQHWFTVTQPAYGSQVLFLGVYYIWKIYCLSASIGILLLSQHVRASSLPSRLLHLESILPFSQQLVYCYSVFQIC